MYDLVRGPMVWVAFLVFIIGTIYQVVRFYSLSRKNPQFRLIKPTGGPPKTEEPPSPPELTFGQRLRLSIAGTNPMMVAITTVFHVLLVFTPFFVLGHNVLWDLAWGIKPPSFSESFTDVLTLIVIGGGIYFLCRRLFMARVRSITSAYDYVILAIATAPFITGFLAYRHIFDYDTVILLHMLAGEIMLIAIPFTKLVHMPFFFINRFLLVHENTFGAGGSRIWR